jgi:hypothetical protein
MGAISDGRLNDWELDLEDIAAWAVARNVRRGSGRGSHDDGTPRP